MRRFWQWLGDSCLAVILKGVGVTTEGVAEAAVGCGAIRHDVRELRIERLEGQPACLAELQTLRVQAWTTLGVVPRGTVHGRWGDSHDSHATHVVARDLGGAIVAAARICLHAHPAELPDAAHYRGLDLAFPCAAISRMVVRPDWWRRGVSNLLDAVRLEVASEQGAECVVGCTSAGARRIAALESLGFELQRQMSRAQTTGRPGAVLVRVLRCSLLQRYPRAVHTV